MKYYFISILLFFSFDVIAQSGVKENIREDRRFGIGLQLGGPTLLVSAAFDYSINANINVEIGFGAYGMYGGSKLYFRSGDERANWSPYAGALLSVVMGRSSADVVMYLPVGAQYIAPKGFTFAGEIAVIAGSYTAVWGGLKLGHHF